MTEQANTAGVWAIRESYGYSPVKVVRETEKCLFYTVSLRGRECRGDKSSFVDWRGNEADAHKLAEKLTVAADEKTRLVREAATWFKERRALLIAEARKAGDA